MSEAPPLTPMLRQYFEVKERYKDCLLFFRMGDFYEMFFEDAEIGAKVLGIALTSRGEYKGKRVPMAGVPYHAAKGYLARLVSNGYKVAICEQLEDPRYAKGIVKRDVIRVVTPGSAIDEDLLADSQNLFILALSKLDLNHGLAYADLSTGLFMATELTDIRDLQEEVFRIQPAEVIVPKDSLPFFQHILDGIRLEPMEPIDFEIDRCTETLREHFRVASLKGLGLEGLKASIIASGALLRYLRATQKTRLDHIDQIRIYNPSSSMVLDSTCIKDLELIKNPRTNTEEDTLVWAIDRTNTPMGKRCIRQWLLRPLKDIDSINERLDGVESFLGDQLLRRRLAKVLTSTPDLERLAAKISMGRANPRDLLSLKEGLKRVREVKELLNASKIKGLAKKVSLALDPVAEAIDLIESSISDSCPNTPKEMGIIKEGYSPELDRLIRIMRSGKDWIAAFAREEQEKTGIPNLRVGFNKVFGYYIEITKSYLHMVPKDYIRKQTLSGAERFINQALKEKEEEVLSAEERRLELEAHIYSEITQAVASYVKRIQETSRALGILDVLLGLSTVAAEREYVRPILTEEPILQIMGGRHPVLEGKARTEPFVPNDISIDPKDQQVLIITGPNMAGKSTILRQTALIVILAQIGSFVPATSATIGVADRIFTRIGASDDIAKGQSTFMVEMSETANILRNATPESLVILDEVGRGTSTYDGMSIAWAVVEALHSLGGKGVRTLFATHYHELTELGRLLPRVKNYTMDVKEWNNSVVFLRKLRPGAADRSYGIEVARIAGIPEAVLNRAKEILADLEQQTSASSRPNPEVPPRPVKKLIKMPIGYLSEQRLRNWITSLDLDNMTPLDALMELKRIKEYFEKQGDLYKGSLTKITRILN